MKQLVVIVKASDGISSKTKEKKKGSDPKNIVLAEFDCIWIR